MLEQTKALWFQAISEARANPSKEQVLRAYAAQFTRHGERQRARQHGDPQLRRPGDAQASGARTHVSRQPLRLADAAVDRRDLLDRLGREGLYEVGEKDD